MTATTETTTVQTDLYINGEHRSTPETIDVPDPAKPGRIVGRAASASKDDVAEAVASAKAAAASWGKLSAAERAEHMRTAIAGIADNRDEDARILSQENGKIVQEAWVDPLVLEIRWNLALDLVDEVERSTVLDSAPGIPTRTEVAHKPTGVVTIIVPFNWPIAILGASLPHALLAGNTVIVKSPPSTPLATTLVTQRIAEKLPPGVLNVITGKDENMSALIHNEDIAKVSFTGSVGGGKKMMEMASGSLTAVVLELGGNDAALILEDAILDDAHLDRLFSAIYDTAGQICMNAKRIFVHRSRIGELTDGLAARLEKVRLGYGLDPETTMGPLNSPKQKEFVDELIAEAKASGAEVREYAQLPDGEMSGGNFVRPALVIDPDTSLRVVTEEQFGPVIPLIPFDDEAEAIAAANDTWAGLSGSVWTADPEAAQRVGGQLQCGYVWVNDHGAPRLDLRAPFGGVKNSGIGREQGIEGVRAFQESHSISVLDPEVLAAMQH